MKNNQLKLILPAIFLMIMVGIHAQNVRVTGVVSDAQSPLIGVNVHVKGGTTGVITDMNGKYSIEVPSNATLVFSYIGYADQEHKVGNRKVIDVTMSEDSYLWQSHFHTHPGGCSPAIPSPVSFRLRFRPGRRSGPSFRCFRQN